MTARLETSESTPQITTATAGLGSTEGESRQQPSTQRKKHLHAVAEEDATETGSTARYVLIWWI